MTIALDHLVAVQITAVGNEVQLCFGHSLCQIKVPHNSGRGYDCGDFRVEVVPSFFNLVTDCSLAQGRQTIAKYLGDSLAEVSFGTGGQAAREAGSETLVARVTFKNALFALFAAALE